jgi:excisionase family DNA binding protein
MQKQTETGAFNVARAAKYIGSSAPTLLRILKTGKLPHRREGKRVFISKAALDRWLEGDTEGAK